jgi:hypothetical protein
MYHVAKGTTGKLVKLLPNKDAEVVDWTTRKDFNFTASLIDPLVVKTMVVEAAKKPLAVRMAEEGYALFGGENGGDRNAQYVLAIPYSQIKVINGA